MKNSQNSGKVNGSSTHLNIITLYTLHTHVILRTSPDLAQAWSPHEIATRWWYVFPKRKEKFGNPAEPKEDDLDQILFDPKTGDPLGNLELLRKRLASISLFMRCLNEYIARRANREDNCQGRFWEGRFKSVELLDQAAVLACMAYIDLNPVHAGVAQTPESSDFTSAQDRIRAKVSKDRLQAMRKKLKEQQLRKNGPDELDNYKKKIDIQSNLDQWLSPIQASPADQPTPTLGSFLNMDLNDYLQILDWTGRQHRLDKTGKNSRKPGPDPGAHEHRSRSMAGYGEAI